MILFYIYNIYVCIWYIVYYIYYIIKLPCSIWEEWEDLLYSKFVTEYKIKNEETWFSYLLSWYYNNMVFTQWHYSNYFNFLHKYKKYFKAEKKMYKFSKQKYLVKYLLNYNVLM